MLRGEVTPRVAALEAARRMRDLSNRRRERADLSALDQQPARLGERFAQMKAPDLLAHFRSRSNPKFLPGFQDIAETAKLQQELFPQQTAQLLEAANRIINAHCWPLLGFGEKCFGKNAIQWNRDPLSGYIWPLHYHADINLFRSDGSDGRVTWEVNRLSHFITLGRAYAITNDERFSAEFFCQLGSWRTQNPVARGINWTCAMEAALRAINLLTAFTLFVGAPQMDEVILKELLRVFDQHGAHIKRNLEFSHIATSNHYLADVAGLLWIGVMLPELQAANEWREFGLRELLREVDKQTLSDGADYEASTGYHRLKVELHLYSLLLCRANGIEIDEKYRTKVRAMIDYIRAYLRPEGRAPLIGDTDSGQLMPIVKRTADDQAYLLALGAATFKEPSFKLPSENVPEELLWMLGPKAVQDYRSLPDTPMHESRAFPDAGIFVLRHNDLYLLFSASECGVKGRGSHGHNDALSIEVSAYGVPFIVDPGTFLYVANLKERQRFRSTTYHSTVEVDALEQNTIDEELPFIIGN
ncbi:MAG TPA: alginate lyase family protein, partial [Pyrinomonadaceae bacterium]|nr:alginate lyase family protein [Pyrinomonadaceae bacterium]